MRRDITSHVQQRVEWQTQHDVMLQRVHTCEHDMCMLRDEKTQLQAQLDVMTERVTAMQQHIHALTCDKGVMQQQHDAAMQQVAVLTQQQEHVATQHAHVISNMEMTHELAMAAMESRHAHVTTQHAHDMTSLNTQHQHDITSMDVLHEHDMSAMSRQHAHQHAQRAHVMSTLEAEMHAEMAAYEEAQAQMEEEMDVMRDAMHVANMRVTTLTDAMTCATTQIASLHAQHTQQTHVITSLQTQLDDVTRAYDTAQQTHVHVMAEMEQQMRLWDVMEEEMVRVLQQSHEMQDNNMQHDVTAAHAHEMTQQRVMYETQLTTQHDTHVEEMTHARMTAQQQHVMLHAEWQHKLDAATSHVTSLQTQLDDMRVCVEQTCMEHEQRVASRECEMKQEHDVMRAAHAHEMHQMRVSMEASSHALLAQLNTQHATQQQAWEQEMRDARTTWDTRINMLQAQLEAAPTHVHVETELQQQLVQIQKQLQTQVEKMSALQHAHDIAMSSQATALKQQHDAEMRMLQSEHDDVMTLTEVDATQRQEQEQHEWSVKYAAVEGKMQQMLAQNVELMQQIKTQQDAYVALQTQWSELQQQHESETTQHTQAHATLQQQHENETKQHAQEIETWKQQQSGWNGEKQAMQQQVETLLQQVNARPCQLLGWFVATM